MPPCTEEGRQAYFTTYNHNICSGVGGKKYAKRGAALSLHLDGNHIVKSERKYEKLEENVKKEQTKIFENPINYSGYGCPLTCVSYND